MIDGGHRVSVGYGLVDAWEPQSAEQLRGLGVGTCRWAIVAVVMVDGRIECDMAWPWEPHDKPTRRELDRFIRTFARRDLDTYLEVAGYGDASTPWRVIRDEL